MKWFFVLFIHYLLHFEKQLIFNFQLPLNKLEYGVGDILRPDLAAFSEYTKQT